MSSFTEEWGLTVRSRDFQMNAVRMMELPVLWNLEGCWGVGFFFLLTAAYAWVLGLYVDTINNDFEHSA